MLLLWEKRKKEYKIQSCMKNLGILSVQKKKKYVNQLNQQLTSHNTILHRNLKKKGSNLVGFKIRPTEKFELTKQMFFSITLSFAQPQWYNITPRIYFILQTQKI